MANTTVNHVQLGDGTQLIDLRNDTLRADVLLQGYTGHDASGAQVVGELTPKTLFQTAATSTYADNYYEIRFPVPDGISAADLLANENFFIAVWRTGSINYIGYGSAHYIFIQLGGVEMHITTASVGTSSNTPSISVSTITPASQGNSWNTNQFSAGEDNTLVHRAYRSSYHYMGDYKAVVGLL